MQTLKPLVKVVTSTEVMVYINKKEALKDYPELDNEACFTSMKDGKYERYETWDVYNLLST
jgi:hypothetical protein